MRVLNCRDNAAFLGSNIKTIIGGLPKLSFSAQLKYGGEVIKTLGSKEVQNLLGKEKCEEYRQLVRSSISLSAFMPEHHIENDSLHLHFLRDAAKLRDAYCAQK